ncbi:MAG: T9SS type A sorting domain-containing protein, partial [Candidatus Cloacimonetes bacterium]|nr:T9SS type A sorting domain-containing protein [Candidatus Cloacimonadota bacterium]
NVIISENIAAFGGGGIFLSTTTITLSNVVINHNEASGGLSPDGGGIYSMNSVSVLANVTIAENTTWGEYGGIYCKDNSNFTLSNCILWNDSTAEIYLEDSSIDVVYSDIQGGWVGEGNIDEDPYFINPAIGLFTLSMYSPCIGAGIDEIEINGTWYYAPLFDIEGNPRPDPAGSMPDMGAYESFLGEPQVGIEDCQLSIVDFRLYNYPNPFNPETTINYSLKENSKVSLKVYNIKGQKVKTLVHEVLPAGEHSIVWDGSDSDGKRVVSGIYFYKLKSGDYQKINKMILIK